MTIPTLITILRMIIVPFYGAYLLMYGMSMGDGGDEHYRYVAMGLFATASVSDYVDGFIARRFNMQSQLGAYLDPFADKMLLLTSIIFMAQYKDDWWQLPVWFMVIVVGRDVLIIYGVWLLMAKKKPIYFDPHWTGKACTISQITVVSLYLLRLDNLGLLTTILASVFTVWSGVVYFRHGWGLLQMPSVSK